LPAITGAVTGKARFLLSTGMAATPIFKERERKIMLWTIIAILLVLWLLGLIGQVGGGLIHLLLVVAAVVLLIQLISGRRTVV
jgi:hypothetical protein